MTFEEFVEQQVKITKQLKTEFLKRFAKKCGLSFSMLAEMSRGKRLVRYDKAKQVSIATNNAVSIKELCEE